jgi:hypothetical protein
MERGEWEQLLVVLEQQSETIQRWLPTDPEPTALRSEHSKHRTLAHLWACQEQWLVVVTSFIERPSPSVTILHPWRQFDANDYANLAWDQHMTQFLQDRQKWLALRDSVDWERGGKWNRKPDTNAGLTQRLADHEAYHISLCLVD